MWQFFSQANKGTQVTLKISGMHCTNCSLTIDNELEDLSGVYTAQTQFAKSQTRISYDPDKISLTQIVKAIKNLGYEAEVPTASEV